MASPRLNLALIGAGRIGRVHAENIAFRVPAVRLVAITDLNRDAAAKVADRCGIPQVVDSADAILADRHVDAVLICSSTDTHAELALQAARAGKHIFCEKPIDFNLTRIDAVLDAVAAAKVKFQTGFNRRFDPTFARMRLAVTEGEIGTPQLLHIISRDPAPPPLAYIKISGGIFLDMTIHDFDMARFLIGDEVAEVFACGGVMVDPAIGAAGDLDTAIVLLKFENGALATIDNCRQAAFGYDQRAELLGSLGKIATDNCYPHTATISNRQSVYRDLPYRFFMDRYTESFLREIQAFVQAIADDTPTPVTGRDGRLAVALGLAARQSVEERRPVRLDEMTGVGTSRESTC